MFFDRCFAGASVKVGVAKISYGIFQARLSIPLWIVSRKLAVMTHQAKNFIIYRFPIYDGRATARMTGRLAV